MLFLKDRSKLLSALVGSLLILSGFNAVAEEGLALIADDEKAEGVSPEGEKGVVKDLTGFSINDTDFMKKIGVEAGGWLEFGVAGNFNNPFDSGNGPVTFNDRANEFNVQEVYGYLERAVNDQGDSWDFGFRADVVYGTDARFTTASNFDDNLVGDSASRFYKLAFPQAYVDVFAPVGNGLTTKIGHFYTIIGYEVVPGKDNFFFSHAYTMQYGEPFTHTGILSSYTINDNISVTGGVVTGWDSWFQAPGNFLGGVNLSSDDGNTGLAVSLISGAAELHKGDNNRTMYSIVFNHDFDNGLHYVFQHDYGTQDKATDAGTTARWYGVNQYVFYDVSDDLGAGLRFEWFRDEQGVRVGKGSNSYFEITAGVNWNPLEWLMLRPEVRYDWSTHNNAYPDDPYNTYRSNQFLLSADAIITF